MSTWSLTYQQTIFKQCHSNKHFSAFYPQDGGEKRLAYIIWNKITSLSPCVYFAINQHMPLKNALSCHFDSPSLSNSCPTLSSSIWHIYVRVCSGVITGCRRCTTRPVRSQCLLINNSLFTVSMMSTACGLMSAQTTGLHGYTINITLHFMIINYL